MIVCATCCYCLVRVNVNVFLYIKLLEIALEKVMAIPTPGNGGNFSSIPTRINA